MSAARIDVTYLFLPSFCGGSQQYLQNHMPAELQTHLDKQTWEMFRNDFEAQMQPYRSRFLISAHIGCGSFIIGFIIFIIGPLIHFLGLYAGEPGDFSSTFSPVIGTSVAGIIVIIVGILARMVTAQRLTGQAFQALQRICSQYTATSGLTFAAVREEHRHGKHVQRLMYIEIQFTAVSAFPSPSVVGHVVQGASCAHCGVQSTGNFCSNCGKSQGRFCTQCNVASNGNFCSKCGKNLMEK